MAFREPPGSYDLCAVCDWEDDAVQLRADWWDFGGANAPLRVEQWKYQRRVQLPDGVVDPTGPQPGDLRDPSWYPLPESAPEPTSRDRMPGGFDYFQAIDAEPVGNEPSPYYWRWREASRPPRPDAFR